MVRNFHCFSCFCCKRWWISLENCSYRGAIWHMSSFLGDVRVYLLPLSVFVCCPHSAVSITWTCLTCVTPHPWVIRNTPKVFAWWVEPFHIEERCNYSTPDQLFSFIFFPHYILLLQGILINPRIVTVCFSTLYLGLPWWLSGKESACCRRRRRQWHPTPVLLPGKSHGRRTLVDLSPWGR